MNNIVAIIPAYNEEKTIGKVIKGILESQLVYQQGRRESSGFRPDFRQYSIICIVIDDGSSDKTAQVAHQAGAIVLSHPINCGLGAALATGIEAAIKLITNQQITNNSVIVTLDADGQHDPKEIGTLIEPILKGEADVVVGSRFKCGTQNLAYRQAGVECKIPLSRRIANFCGNLLTWFLFGIHVTDSQSGFRAFSAAAARKIRIRTNTMEVSSEILREVKLHNLRLREVPITPIYTDYSLSKGQGFFKGIETLWKLIILKFFR